MMKKFSRQANTLAMIFITAASLATATPASAQMVVSDPIADVQNFVQQVQYWQSELNNAERNLTKLKTPFQTLKNSLSNLEITIQNGKVSTNLLPRYVSQSFSDIDTDVANAQAANDEAGSADGSLQVQQAQAKLQADIVVALQKLRQAQLTELQQRQNDDAAVLQYMQQKPLLSSDMRCTGC